MPCERIRAAAAERSDGGRRTAEGQREAAVGLAGRVGAGLGWSRSAKNAACWMHEPAVEQVEGLEGRGGGVAPRGHERGVGAVEGAEGRVLLAPGLELVDHPAEGVGAELVRGAGRRPRSWCSSPRCCSPARPSLGSSRPLQARIASRIDSASSRRGGIRQSSRFCWSTAWALASSRLDWR